MPRSCIQNNSIIYHEGIRMNVPPSCIQNNSIIYHEGFFILFVFRLIDLARKLDKADREALSRSAFYLQKMEQYAYASEVYSKMGDIKSLASLLVEAKLWEEVDIFEFPSSYHSTINHGLDGCFPTA